MIIQSSLGAVPCCGREACVPLWSSELYWREPCVAGRSVGEGSDKTAPWSSNSWDLDVGSATLPHKNCSAPETPRRIHHSLGSWRTSRTKTNDTWQWKPGRPGSCQAKMATHGENCNNWPRTVMTGGCLPGWPLPRMGLQAMLMMNSSVTHSKLLHLMFT